jgi:acyl dehydratase
MEEKTNYYQLKPGFEFPAKKYKMDYETVSDYINSVGEKNEIYKNTGLVPPMALAALAMAAMAEGSSFPPGTVHVSQELEFSGTVYVGDTIECSGKVARRQDRGGLHLMTTELYVCNGTHDQVLTGKVGFILPD